MNTKVKLIISLGLLAFLLLFTVQLNFLAKHNQELKRDYSEVSHIRYGLLNVNEWEDRVSSVIVDNIDEFELTPENRKQLQSSVENILYLLIDEVEVLMEDRTSGGFSGIKKWAASLALDVDQLRDSVPSLSMMILEEANKPETKEKFKKYLIEKLHHFTKNTYNRDDMKMMDDLLQRYNCNSKQECKLLLESRINDKKSSINIRVILILILAFLVFILNLISGIKPNKYQVFILIFTSLCLLVSGIGTPMIDLEARIDSLMFKLMGKDIIFTDQIIFFQSKSITDVVIVLIKNGTIQMIMVGVLVFTFSIVFPVSKLISSYIYYHNFFNLRKNKIINFFVVKSGKWSMADVMVVAIFMSFIGLNGIVNNQLTQLSIAAKPVEILTTNGTTLLGGFYLFLFFCISSLVLSEVLTRNIND